ncbi:MAG: shikimate dehydrogenase [Lachnospiraceae bacterium]|jgi:shikimate dehydrogenase|nr:shikimate dehydrogenase [Lachnospiraceae bacterium]
MTVSANTKLYGLIGNPTAHSLSPLLFSSLAELMGHNLLYTTFTVAVGDDALAKAVAGGYELGIGGFNITAPFKEKVIPYLAEMDEAAVQIGAVNTLLRGEHGFIGYNTDHIGLWRALKAAEIELEDAKVLLMGAGGAARAAAYACGDKGANTVLVFNRSNKRAARLVNDMNGYFGGNRFKIVTDLDDEQLGQSDLVAIKCTSPAADSWLEMVINPQIYERITAAMDINYHSEEMFFLKTVVKAGGKAYNGLMMLLHQGIAAYELWHHVDVPCEIKDKIAARLAAV